MLDTNEHIAMTACSSEHFLMTTIKNNCYFHYYFFSPQKGLRTPTKTPIKTPSKVRDSAEKGSTGQDELMSPKKAVMPRCLFGSTETTSIPSYERYHKERTAEPLVLPFKYKSLLTIFQHADWVCATYYNRNETITFDKMEPVVKRATRKDFTQKHLAQIKYLCPDAFTFEQRKMVNPGSHSKVERYQLVIAPNVRSKHLNEKIIDTDASPNDEDIVRKADAKTVNPTMLTIRLKQFEATLLDRVKHEHDIFLRSLQPPVVIPKERIQRWHQDFDLELCPDILAADLPQPPNIERFSSAKDILSTARNLFNRFDETKATTSTTTVKEAPAAVSEPPPTPTTSIEDDVRTKLLKNIPKALVCTNIFETESMNWALFSL